MLGSGAFGGVYLAENPLMEPPRSAIKVLHAHVAQNEELRKRFFNEARAAGYTNHPNIVHVFDAGVDSGGLCFLRMEMLDGRTLASDLEKGPLGLSRTCHIGSQIASALAAAHGSGIVHRDLKPENILLIERDGDPDFIKVLDFGIAKLRDAGVATMMYMGSPRYSSPEQFRDMSRVDPRSDIYTLGIILFQCLTGRLPFQASGLEAWAYAHCSQRAPSPGQFVQLPPWVAQLILRMLEKDPARRPQSMAEVRQVLLTGVVRRRLPLLFLGGGATVGLLGLLLAWRGLYPGQPGREARPLELHEKHESPAAPPQKEAASTPPRVPKEMAALGSFAIGKYEVSMGEFREFAQKTGLSAPMPWDHFDRFDSYAKLPMNRITQQQAEAYCAWRYPAQQGRLPTEAEWEFAATDGGKHPFPWGDEMSQERVQAGRRAEMVATTAFSAGASSAGVLNLLGNVAEWTHGTAAAGKAAVRGGTLKTSLDALSAKTRELVPPKTVLYTIGFRCAFDLP